MFCLLQLVSVQAASSSETHVDGTTNFDQGTHPERTAYPRITAQFDKPAHLDKVTNFQSGASSDPKIALATELLKKSLEFYPGCGALAFKLKTDVSLCRDGKTTHKIDVAQCDFVRSQYLRVRMIKPKQRGIVAVDGADAIFYSPKWGSFAQSKLASMEQIFADPDFNFVTDGDFGWSLLSQLTSKDPFAEFMKNRAVKSYDGVVSRQGRKCHQITAIDIKDGSAQRLWIAKATTPWIVEFEPAANTEMHGMPATKDGKPSLLTMIATFSDMKADSKIGPFKLPPDSRKVSHFTIESGEDVRQELVGQSAPNFTVRTAYGGSFSLRRKREKIVVMEFWATWCAPCVRALPALDEISKQFADGSIEFIAINLKEEEKKVREFLASKGLKVRVGIDTAGKVANSYRVSGIPQTVIIGRDGVVKAIYVGAGSEIKEQVAKVLQDLVSNSVH